MKTKLFSLIAFVAILFQFSCQTKVGINPDCALTASDSTNIINAVLSATESFANANNQLNAKGVINFWCYNDPDFIIFENSTIHPSGEILEKGVTEFYAAGIDSTSLNWTKRDVIPLSKEFAQLTGEYNFYLKLNSGDVQNVHVFYSALFKEITGNWKALRVHESYSE